jgi:hypothetical protein
MTSRIIDGMRTLTQVAKANFENNHLSLDGPPDCYDEAISLQLAGCMVRDL